MLLRLVVLFSLIAAITTVLAAPPRFGFQEAEVGVAAEGSGSPFIDAKPVSPDNPANPTPEAVSIPPATESAAVTMTPPQTPAKVEPKAEKRGFFWMFSRKKDETTELVHKPGNALVPTEKYHKSTNEQLNSANLYEYRSGYQSYWQGDTSRVMCSIQQQIPNYGYVEFRQGVGQPLQFAMYVNHPPAGIGKARVRIQPPYWRHYENEKDLGTIELEAGKRAVSMQADWSNRLLLSLRDGMQPVIHYWDAADATADIEIMLSALNFQDSLNSFHKCLGQVLTYDVKDTERTILHFSEDSSKLRPQATDQLDEVLQILKLDPGVKQVDVELYSTGEGLANYNFRLSTRRARAVRDYLMKHGIDEKRILIKIHTKTNADLKQLGYNLTDVHVVLKREKEQ